jgi:putative endonuclease
MPQPWVVYMLRCRGGSLYTGVTTDLDRRVRQHSDGVGGAYTRTHRPVRLVYREDGFTRSEALKREAALKALDAADKRALVRRIETHKVK